MLYLRHKITTNVQHWQIFRAKDALRARVRGHFGAAWGCRVVLPWASRGPVAGGGGGGLAAGGCCVLPPAAQRVVPQLFFRPRVGRACKTAAAGVPNGPCGSLKRGLLRGLAAGWPPCAAVRRCAGGHPVGPWPPCAGVAEAIRWGRGHRVQAWRRRRSVVFATFLQADANFSRKSFGVSEKVITFAPAYKKHGRLAQLV